MSTRVKKPADQTPEPVLSAGEFEALIDSRTCYVCGQRDDHPRDHVVLPDQSSAFHHVDCGARISPPCEGCAARVAASGNASGAALRSFLTGGM